MKRGISVIILLYLLINILPISAQIGYGGTPPSWNSPKSKLKSQDDLKSNMISNPFTIEQLLEDELKSEELPERVGVNLATQLSLIKDGEWSNIETGERICRLKIESPGATAISVYYSKFNIPNGAKLYIYNQDHTHLLGAYTSQTNPAGGEFVTEFVAGDNLIFEYVASSSQTEVPQIDIERICYGYKNLKVSTSELLSCMVDVVCSEGDLWQEEKDGVIKMVTPIGNYSYLCSATLLNNTSQDFTPYIYTAFHCLEGDGKVATEIELLQTLFYFNYEATECGGSEIKEFKTLAGCQFLEGRSIDSREGLDQALLLLRSEFPASLTPYFNGWDRGVTPPQSGVGIHHPKGAVKKISTYISPAVSGTWPSIGTGEGVNGYWIVEYTSTANGFSATEGGSSGSPLFNQNKLVTGTLTGGNSSCTYPSGSNYYGKLQRFWSYVSSYLDPTNSGVLTLNGIRKGDAVSAPKALNARFAPDAAKVELTWLPLEEQPSNYIVYRNGEIIGHPTSNRMVDEELYTGRHIYQVSAYYSDRDLETAKSNYSIIEKHSIVTPDISDVTRISENNLVLNWTIPQSEQTIFWGKESAVRRLASKTPPPLYFGQMWSTSDLSGMDGYVIKRIKTTCLPDINYTLYIRQGASIYTQSLPQTATDKEVEIILDKEFVINSKEPLYCTLRVNSGTGYLVKTDGDKIVEGKGNVVSENGYDWLNLDTKGNISIKAVISPPLTTFSGVENVSNFDSVEEFSSLPVTFNLPINYNLYRNNELVATLSGKVSKYTDRNLKQGENYEYRVEAVYADGERRSSTPYNFYLTDKSYTAQIEELRVNEEKLLNSTLNQYNYPAKCSNDFAEIEIIPKDNGIVIINGERGLSYVKDISAGGKYTIPITVISESNENQSEYQLNIYKLPQEIIIRRWDDVLSVINNSENNGALNFVEYEWYMNGERLPYTTPYITLPREADGEDLFSVKVKTEEGVELRSCDKSFLPQESNIYLYPAIVEQGGNIKINITTPEPCTVTATLANSTGQVMPLALKVGDNVIEAPQTSGAYIVNIQLSNGTKRSVKFMVK